MKISTFPITILGIFLSSSAALAQSAPTTAPSPAAYRAVREQVEANFQHQIIEKWFPAAVDEKNGGFLENFREDWSPGAAGQKSIVYQARLTWLSAAAAMHEPDKAAQYIALSRRGFAVLADKMWDKERGGFYWTVDDSGKPIRQGATEKHVYGNAFALYACAFNFQATHDEAALDLAKKGFRWLEEHAHDDKNGGYFEALSLDGKPLDASAPGSDEIGTRHGRKSMNTNIHVLEALTGLYAIWPEPAVRVRFKEIFDIGMTKIYSEPGYLKLFFNADWTPVDSRSSFGHDIETAYLLAEASAALGKPDDERVWTAGRHLVDHALSVGFDKENGGFYNEGTVAGGNLDKQKIWWVEAEGLNALLLMHEHFGKETPKYWDAFNLQWNFISKYQIDAAHGGWYSAVRPDGSAIPGKVKSDMWTEGYHQGRAMLNVSATLGRLARDK